MPFKDIMLFLVLLFSTLVNAAEEKLVDEYDPVSDIMHHIKDSHSWHLWGEGDKSVSIPLPVIIWDGSLRLFSSSRFGRDGDGVVSLGQNHYRLYHDRIYRTDEHGDIELHGDHPANERPLDFSLTKTAIQMILVMLVLLFLGFRTAGSYRKSQVPSGLARFVEPIVIFVRDDIAFQNIGILRYKRFVPYLCSLFLFILLVNLFGLVPNSANVSGNIAFTFVLSFITLVLVLVNGRRTYWSHIFDPLGKTMPFSKKILIYVILVPVEILGIFTKPFALMIRLFANMTAGHIIILSLVSLIFIMKSYAVAPLSLFLTLFINMLELLVAVLQAYIFTLLTALFIGMAVEDGRHAH